MKEKVQVHNIAGVLIGAFKPFCILLVYRLCVLFLFNFQYFILVRWKLRIKDRINNKEVEDIFDGVMICIGHHGSKYFPKFPGADIFQVCTNKLISNAF